MSSLPIVIGVYGGETQGAESGLRVCGGKNLFASDLLGTSFKGMNWCWLKDMERSKVRSGRKFRVLAMVKKGKKHIYPWSSENIDPNMKSGHLKYLSHFKPLKEDPKPVTLPFEKPVLDLEKKIDEVRRIAEDTGLDFSDQINSLENKYQQARKDLYTHLTPIQRLSIARHPNRPTVLDHILNITEKWVELHGDRAGYDDPAIVTGLGSIDGKTYMFIGHQKGRNTKENIERNFAMPTPQGYRKALRLMKYADHHSIPIVTFIDTPGAFADLKSEELGQGEAIAQNLRTMFGLKVPIISIVTGEGGSGGALAIGCGNKLFMLENSAFYVASPEACAAILWKSSGAAPKAAEKLKITAKEHYKRKIADGIIPEPLGGAHRDPAWTSEQIKIAIIQAMEELGKMDTDELLHHRMLKFRSIGGFQEGAPVDPEKKRNMKASDIDKTPKIPSIKTKTTSVKKKKKILKAKKPLERISAKEIEVKKAVDQEMTKAFISMGLQEKLEALKMQLCKTSDGTPNSLQLNSELKEQVGQLMEEFDRNLSQPGAYLGLKQKLERLNRLNLLKQKVKRERLKAKINRKVQAEMKAEMKAEMEALRNADNKLAEGDQLDEAVDNEAERVKEKLTQVLRSANLEIVGVGERNIETVRKADEEISKEIERAVNEAGLRGKIEELKEEIVKGSSPEKVNKLEADIKQGITAVMDTSILKQKFESLRVEMPLQEDTVVGGSMGTDNGRR